MAENLRKEEEMSLIVMMQVIMVVCLLLSLVIWIIGEYKHINIGHLPMIVPIKPKEGVAEEVVQEFYVEQLKRLEDWNVNMQNYNTWWNIRKNIIIALSVIATISGLIATYLLFINL